jgi:cytochrome c oxidase subunit IV
MIDKIFILCVDFLEWLADKLHMTYEQINVLIFVVIYPLIILVLLTLLLSK